MTRLNSSLSFVVTFLPGYGMGTSRISVRVGDTEVAYKVLAGRWGQHQARIEWQNNSTTFRKTLDHDFLMSVAS